MSDAADRRIADLEHELMLRDQRISRYEVTSNTRLAETRSLEQRIKELEAKLVQRDVYEAEQRLPPEHAVLIKHLATVERCITEGPVTYHYAEESDCSFCGEWQGHTRDCAWFALQFERGVTSVIDDIHAVALQEHERRERQRMPREPARPGATLEQMNNIFREMYGPMVRPMTAAERGAEIHREIQGLNDTLRDLWPSPQQLVHGEWPDRPQRPPVIHQSGPVVEGIGPISLCGVEYSIAGYPSGAPTVTCPACLALLFPPKPEVP